jgi:hypothetical protein
MRPPYRVESTRGKGAGNLTSVLATGGVKVNVTGTLLIAAHT